MNGIVVYGAALVPKSSWFELPVGEPNFLQFVRWQIGTFMLAC